MFAHVYQIEIECSPPSSFTLCLLYGVYACDTSNVAVATSSATNSTSALLYIFFVAFCIVCIRAHQYYHIGSSSRNLHSTSALSNRKNGITSRDCKLFGGGKMISEIKALSEDKTNGSWVGRRLPLNICKRRQVQRNQFHRDFYGNVFALEIPSVDDIISAVLIACSTLLNVYRCCTSTNRIRCWECDIIHQFLGVNSNRIVRILQQVSNNSIARDRLPNSTLIEIGKFPLPHREFSKVNNEFCLFNFYCFEVCTGNTKLANASVILYCRAIRKFSGRECVESFVFNYSHNFILTCSQQLCEKWRKCPEQEQTQRFDSRIVRVEFNRN